MSGTRAGVAALGEVDQQRCAVDLDHDRARAAERRGPHPAQRRPQHGGAGGVEHQREALVDDLDPVGLGRPRGPRPGRHACAPGEGPGTRTGHKPVTPSPAPACSSKFSCSSRWRSGTPILRRAREDQSTWKNSCDHVGPGQHDHLAAVDAAHRVGQRGDGIITDDLALGGGTGSSQGRERLRQRVLGLPLGLLTDRLHLLDVQRHRGGGEGVGAHGTQRGLDPGGGVLRRQQHVVVDVVVETLVEGPHLRGVGGRERLLDEQHHGVGLGHARLSRSRGSVRPKPRPTPVGPARRSGRRRPVRRAGRSRSSPGRDRCATAGTGPCGGTCALPCGRRPPRSPGRGAGARS